MRHETGIQWTWVPGYIGATWNPTVGCTRVSPGCDNCYAFQLHDQRYAANVRASLAYGISGMRGRDVIAAARFVGAKLLPPQYDRPFSEVQLLDEKRLTAPLRAKKPRAYFVDSMADLFHEDVPDEFIDRVFAVMAVAPQHIFMILTKRPERMQGWVSRWNGSRAIVDPRPGENDFLQPRPLPNVWLGVSAEDQQRADERIPLLLATPAVKRFVSAEPLLGPIDLAKFAAIPARNEYTPGVLGGASTGLYQSGRPGISWLIVGGESGARARPFDLESARDIVAQCRAMGVAVFVKQLGQHVMVREGAWRTGVPTGLMHVRPRLKDRHGANPEEWPEDLRVREWPDG